MKQLCLIRHAKSSWHDAAIADIDRPLDERGEINASLLGGILQTKGLKPDMIVCSSAKRANHTANLIAETIEFPTEQIIIDPTIYDAQVDDLLSVIQGLQAQYNTVILVGHNPGITLLANYLADDHVTSLPTCGVYCIEFDTDDWAEITMAESKTLFITSPHKCEE